MNEDNRLTTAWNCMTHLVTTLIVLQNFIPLKKFSLVVNVISLVPSCPISKSRLIRRVFAKFVRSAKQIFVFKIYFYKNFINM